jgi:death-on-curing protein
MSEIDFLSVQDVIELHADQIAAYGGSEGLRDVGLLESAVAQPQASFDGKYVHPNLFLMAAAYAFHIAQNQPFLDGNKRTGLHAALVFLHLNGYSIQPAPERLYKAMMDIADHKLDKSGLAELFRELSRPLDR